MSYALDIGHNLTRQGHTVGPSPPQKRYNLTWTREPRVLTVPEVGDGMRLDRFLAKRFRDRSRAWCAKGIRDKEVCDAHDRPLRAAHRVRAGDVLHLYLKGIAPSAPPPPLPPILHEDDRVLVVNKPAGLLTHPAGTDFVYSLIGLLKEQHPGQHVNLIHRIDRDTSGALLIAKDLEADRFLKERFVQGKVSKAYDALVRSPVAWDQTVVDAPIGPKGEVIRIRRMVRDDGLDAKTTFSVLGRNDALTHIRCMIHTGRTHQIRVHLEHLGLPIIGDRLYGCPQRCFYTPTTTAPTASWSKPARHDKRFTPGGCVSSIPMAASSTSKLPCPKTWRLGGTTLRSFRSVRRRTRLLRDVDGHLGRPFRAIRDVHPIRKLQRQRMLTWCELNLRFGLSLSVVNVLRIHRNRCAFGHIRTVDDQVVMTGPFVHDTSRLDGHAAYHKR